MAGDTEKSLLDTEELALRERLLDIQAALLARDGTVHNLSHAFEDLVADHSDVSDQVVKELQFAVSYHKDEGGGLAAAREILKNVSGTRVQMSVPFPDDTNTRPMLQFGTTDQGQKVQGDLLGIIGAGILPNGVTKAFYAVIDFGSDSSFPVLVTIPFARKGKQSTPYLFGVDERHFQDQYSDKSPAEVISILYPPKLPRTWRNWRRGKPLPAREIK